MPEIIRCEDAQIPKRAVVVHVWQSLGRIVADVSFSAFAGVQDDQLIADLPRPVHQTLIKAEQMCQASQLNTIAVVLANGIAWRPEWGQIKEPDVS